MKVVLDSNVLVSGLLSTSGASGRVIDLVIAGAAIACVDSRILTEYEDVLRRPELALRPRDVEFLLSFLEKNSFVATGTIINVRLPDRDDEPFLQVAVAAEADFLVTGNKKHFRKAKGLGVKVVSPSDLEDMFLIWGNASENVSCKIGHKGV